jgi:hypothetical protein
MIFCHSTPTYMPSVTATGRTRSDPLRSESRNIAAEELMAEIAKDAKRKISESTLEIMSPCRLRDKAGQELKGKDFRPSAASRSALKIASRASEFIELEIAPLSLGNTTENLPAPWQNGR